MARLSITQRDELLIRLDERIEKLPEIERHLDKLNGSVNETNIKLAATSTIAKSADKKADGNRKYMDKLTIAVIVAILTGVASVALAAIGLNGSIG